MASPKFVELNPVEISREYTFPCRNVVRIEKAARISVSESGTHRIETEDGRKHIIPKGWIHIELDVPEWTF